MGSKKTKSSSTQSNAWVTPEGQQVLDSSLTSILGGLQNSGEIHGAATNRLTSFMNDGGMNPYLEQAMRGIRAENDINTPALLAQQRSQYRNSPFAAAQFGTDEALRRNAIGRDNALYSALVPAYESGANRSLQAAGLGSTMRSADVAQALQLLDLLKQQNTSSTSKTSGGDIGKLVGALAATVGTVMSGGTLGAALLAGGAAGAGGGK